MHCPEGVPDAYLEVAFAVPGGQVEALAERLQVVAPGGIALEEPYLPLGPDEGVRLEPGRPSVLKVYLPIDDQLAGRQQTLHSALATLPFMTESRERIVHAEDWSQSWKEFFQVEHVGNRIVVCPTWREYLPRPGEIILQLDPGMAFGTGQHPTTRLCLAALEQRVRPGMDILDLGCGSGILSLVAAKLGARSVLALDIESLAVEAARANAVANGVDGIVRVERGSLGAAWPLAGSPDGVVDLIVANINAATIAELAPAILAALAGQGSFIGSGIIGERLDEPLLALAAAGMRVERLASDGDWRAIVGTRS